MIRKYERKDYEAIRSLLQRCDLPVCTDDELEGYGLVWEEQKPIGFVWALVGEGATVFIDHFCVDPDHRDKDATGRSRIAVEMMLRLLTDMAGLGKSRVLGILQDTPYGKSLERIYNQLGMKFFRPHAFVRGNIREVLTNLMKAKNG